MSQKQAENEKATSAINRVFVYGTLKMGFHANAMYLADARLLGHFSIPGVLVHCGGYPGLIRTPHGRVAGQVFEVEPHVFKSLDRYENIDTGLYHRELVTIANEPTWVYSYRRGPQIGMNTAIVKHGLWLGPRSETVPYSTVVEAETLQPTAASVLEIQPPPSKVISLPSRQVIPVTSVPVVHVPTGPIIGPGFEDM